MGIITQVFLPLGLAFIMFSMGLALITADFKRILIQPKAFAFGAFSQLILLPLTAFILVSIWPINPELAVGVMILAVSPGGVTSNLLTHLSKGDTALSISLTAVISILSVFTIPFFVNFSLTHFIGSTQVAILPIGKTIFGIFMITTVPVAAGMLIRHYAKNFAIQIEPIARKMATILFVVLIAGAIHKERNNLASYFAESGFITLALNVIMMTAAFTLAKWLKISRKECIAISLECGLQNGTLAIMIAATFLQNTTMMIPGVIYSLLMFVTGGAFVWIITRNTPTEKPESTEQRKQEIVYN